MNSAKYPKESIRDAARLRPHSQFIPLQIKIFRVFMFSRKTTGSGYIIQYNKYTLHNTLFQIKDWTVINYL